jgi:transcriptional regulator with XRE-family HTH domain
MPDSLSEATTTLGARVRAQRVARGQTQEALGAAAGLHWTFIGQVERGRRNLSLHNLLKLAAALGMDPADLVRGLRPPDPGDPVNSVAGRRA